MDLGRERPQCHQRTSLLCRFAILFPDDTNCPAGILSNIGTVYEHTFTEPGVYSYPARALLIGMTGVVNVSGGCAPSGWSAGPDMPTVLVRAVGVYFQADGNFYTVGGRISDAAGDDFQHVLQYNPTFQQLDSDGIDIAR